MSHAAAIASVVLLVALGVFQGLLASGVPLGRFAWGGQHVVLPWRLRVGSVAAIGIYVLIGWVVVTRAGQPGSGSGFPSVATWVIAGFLLLGVAGNLASKSRSERLVMTPVALVLCALTVAVAMGG